MSEKPLVKIAPSYHVGSRRFLNRDKALRAVRDMVTYRPFCRWLDKFWDDNGQGPSTSEVDAKSKSLEDRANRRITKFPGE